MLERSKRSKISNLMAEIERKKEHYFDAFRDNKVDASTTDNDLDAKVTSLEELATIILEFNSELESLTGKDSILGDRYRIVSEINFAWMIKRLELLNGLAHHLRLKSTKDRLTAIFNKSNYFSEYSSEDFYDSEYSGTRRDYRQTYKSWESYHLRLEFSPTKPSDSDWLRFEPTRTSDLLNMLLKIKLIAVERTYEFDYDSIQNDMIYVLRKAHIKTLTDILDQLLLKCRNYNPTQVLEKILVLGLIKLVLNEIKERSHSLGLSLGVMLDVHELLSDLLSQTVKYAEEDKLPLYYEAYGFTLDEMYANYIQGNPAQSFDVEITNLKTRIVTTTPTEAQSEKQPTPTEAQSEKQPTPTLASAQSSPSSSSTARPTHMMTLMTPVASVQPSPSSSSLSSSSPIPPATKVTPVVVDDYISNCWDLIDDLTKGKNPVPVENIPLILRTFNNMENYAARQLAANKITKQDKKSIKNAINAKRKELNLNDEYISNCWDLINNLTDGNVFVLIENIPLILKTFNNMENYINRPSSAADKLTKQDKEKIRNVINAKREKLNLSELQNSITLDEEFEDFDNIFNTEKPIENKIDDLNKLLEKINFKYMAIKSKDTDKMIAKSIRDRQKQFSDFSQACKDKPITNSSTITIGTAITTPSKKKETSDNEDTGVDEFSPFYDSANDIQLFKKDKSITRPRPVTTLSGQVTVTSGKEKTTSEYVHNIFNSSGHVMR